jgi:dUTPase
MNILISTNKDLPQKAHVTDACADIVATSITFDGKYVEYGTNLKMLPPKDYFGAVFPRSSISNYDLVLANSVGVIDDYTGEWKLRFKRLKQPLIDSCYRRFARKQDDFIRLSNILNNSTFKFFRFSLKNEIEQLRKELIDIDEEIKDLETFEKIYQKGDKIAQFSFLPKFQWTYTLTSELPETVRGEGGFGSTTVSTEVVAKTQKPKSHNTKKNG